MKKLLIVPVAAILLVGCADQSDTTQQAPTTESAVMDKVNKPMEEAMPSGTDQPAEGMQKPQAPTTNIPEPATAEEAAASLQ